MVMAVTLSSTEESSVLQNSPICLLNLPAKEQDVKERRGYNIITCRHMAMAVTLSSIDERLVLQNSPVCMQNFTYKRTGCEREGALIM